ncbi:hypothetical protein BDW74DRAFT_176638 [Aspergillus multicolor]|uniref:uncharacterized protein n=1 Tax=Aspergillus multicolor TaxID=41759 RepID=UPI003CCE05D6
MAAGNKFYTDGKCITQQRQWETNDGLFLSPLRVVDQLKGIVADTPMNKDEVENLTCAILGNTEQELRNIFGKEIQVHMLANCALDLARQESENNMCLLVTVMIDLPQEQHVQHEEYIEHELVPRIFSTLIPEQPQNPRTYCIPPPGQDLCLWRMEWYEEIFEDDPRESEQPCECEH